MWEPDWDGVLEAAVLGARHQQRGHPGGFRHPGTPDQLFCLLSNSYARHVVQVALGPGDNLESKVMHACLNGALV